MDTYLKFYIPVYMVAFFLIAMILPSYQLYKRTGINPVTFGKKTDTAHDYIGVLFKLIFVVIAIYIFLNGFVVFSTITYIDTTIFKSIGMGLSIIALVLIIIAQKTMSDSWRIGIDEKNKTKLVTNGAFQYLRNPIFSGMLLMLISLFLTMPTYFMLYMTVLSCLIINIQVRLEEEYLTRVHKKDYLDYKCKVGRFLPNLHVKYKNQGWF